jgi:hypothetical protein
MLISVILTVKIRVAVRHVYLLAITGQLEQTTKQYPSILSIALNVESAFRFAQQGLCTTIGALINLLLNFSDRLPCNLVQL